MKWNTTNYKGDEVVWYSGDVIEKIKELCSFYVSNPFTRYSEKDTFSQGREHCACQVLDIIEREDK